MESAPYVWNLISNNALLATLVATACVWGISGIYKSLKHHGLLKLSLVLSDASRENSGKDFLDTLLEPAPGVLPLEGRQRELEELYRFIRHEKRKLGIILLTGGGGMGKTRLAAELCSSLSACHCRWKWWEKWDAGFLNPSEDLSSPFFNPEHLGKWWNWRQTLVVVDEAASKRELLEKFLAHLGTKNRSWRKKLFLLLIDRDDGRESGVKSIAGRISLPVCHLPMDVLSDEGAMQLFEAVFNKMNIACGESLIRPYRQSIRNADKRSDWRRRPDYVIMEAVYRCQEGSGAALLENRDDLPRYFTRRDEEKLKLLAEKKNWEVPFLKRLVSCYLLAGIDFSREGDNSTFVKAFHEIARKWQVAQKKINTELYDEEIREFIRNSALVNRTGGFNLIGLYWVMVNLHMAPAWNTEHQEYEKYMDFLELCFRAGRLATWNNWLKVMQDFSDQSPELAENLMTLWQGKLSEEWSTVDNNKSLLEMFVPVVRNHFVLSGFVGELYRTRIDHLRTQTIPGDTEREILLAETFSRYGNMLRWFGLFQEACPLLLRSFLLWKSIYKKNAAFLASFSESFNDLASCRYNMGTPSKLILKSANKICSLLSDQKEAGKEKTQIALGTCLRNLGDLHEKFGEIELSERMINQSIILLKGLDQNNPSVQKELAISLQSDGVHLSHKEETDKAQEKDQESVDLWKGLDQYDPEIRKRLALALRYLGLDLGQKRNWDEALKPTQESVKIWRSLDQHNPEVRKGLALTLYNMGIYLVNIKGNNKNLDKALAADRESVDLLRSLDQNDLGTKKNLAEALSHLGTNLINKIGEDKVLDEAITVNRESMSLWKSLDQNDPEIRNKLAKALDHLGVALENKNNINDALVANQESVEVWRSLNQDDPEIRRGLALALCNRGVFLRKNRYWDEALEADQESVELLRSLELNDLKTAMELAHALNNLGTNLINKMGRNENLDKALAANRESVEVWRSLNQDDPEIRRGLALALCSLGINLLKKNCNEALDESIKANRESVRLLRSLNQNNPVIRKELAKGLDDLGVSFSYKKKWDEALEVNWEGVELFRNLNQNNPEIRYRLAQALNNRGTYLRCKGIWNEALDKALEADWESTDLWRSLDQDNPEIQTKLAISLCNLGIDLSNIGYCDEALERYEESSYILKSLDQNNLEIKEDRIMLLEVWTKIFNKFELYDKEQDIRCEMKKLLKSLPESDLDAPQDNDWENTDL